MGRLGWGQNEEGRLLGVRKKRGGRGNCGRLVLMRWGDKDGEIRLGR